MKPLNKKIDEGKIKSILGAERSSALGSNTSSDLSQQRIKAYDYYMGDMASTMPATPGQSGAVSTDVQDVVEGALPIVLDVIVSGGDEIVEFKPVGAGDEAMARQETQYVNHVFMQENEGFLTLYTALKDALLQKNCFVKWWMEPEEAREREKYKGLTADAFAMLVADTDVEVIDAETYDQLDPATAQPAKYFDAVTERTTKKLRARIGAVAPEEIFVSRNARNIQDASYIAHIQAKPQADIIALFPEKEAVIRAAPAATISADNGEAFNRQTVQDNQDQLNNDADNNKDMREIELAEHYVRMVLEEDKVARRYKITTCGTGTDILDIDEVSSWPFATGTSIIMPHRLFGRALADLVMDVQDVKTSLLRATLNNAYFANNQRLEVSEAHASDNTIDDLLNNRVGGLVRTKMPGGITPIETQSIGHWIMPVVDYMDSVRDNRTGISKASTGLDPGSMDHSRPGAVERIMGASEMRIKLMARIFCETLLVDMFRGLHGMLQEYSEEPAEAQLGKTWVTVDPREWKTRKHMTVSLPLGGASKQQLLGFFAQLLGVQKDIIMEQQGTNGPLVSYQNIHATIEQMTRLAGLKSVDPFLMAPPPPNPNAPKPPDPKMVEAQAKSAATQAQQQSQQQQDQAQFAHDTQMAQLKASAAHQAEQDKFAHKQLLDKMKFTHDADMEKLELGFKLRLSAFETQEKVKLNAQQAKLQARPGVGEV